MWMRNMEGQSWGERKLNSYLKIWLMVVCRLQLTFLFITWSMG